MFTALYYILRLEINVEECLGSRTNFQGGNFNTIGDSNHYLEHRPRGLSTQWHSLIDFSELAAEWKND